MVIEILAQGTHGLGLRHSIPSQERRTTYRSFRSPHTDRNHSCTFPTNASFMDVRRQSIASSIAFFSIAEGFVKTLLHNGGENHASMNRRAIEAIASLAWNAIRISQGRLCHLPLSKISCTAHRLACSLLASLTMANKDSPGTSPKNSSSCLLASRTTLGLLSRSKRTRSLTAPSL